MNTIDVYHGGQLRDISEVREVGVTTIQQFRHLGPFTHPLSISPSVDHDETVHQALLKTFSFEKGSTLSKCHLRAIVILYQTTTGCPKKGYTFVQN